MTVKTRISLLIVGAGVFFGAVFSVVVFFELIEQPLDLLDTILQEEAIKSARILKNHPPERDAEPLDSSFEIMENYWVEVREPDVPTVLFQSVLAKLIKLPPVQPGASTLATVPLPPDWPERKHGGRHVTFRVKTFSIPLDGKPVVVQIARDMEKLKEEIVDLALGIFAGLILSTLLLIAISHLVANKILHPIGHMKELARNISEKNLNQRIPHAEDPDEFGELAKTINQMLDRLQYSFARQRDLLFDTSHELKTPLTTIRLAVDELHTIDEHNVSAALRENLDRLSGQVLRMERLIKDLLNLSSLEVLTGLEKTPIPICTLLSSLVEEYRFLADAKNIGIDLHLPEGLVIEGDEEKLFRAFSNILDNAIKYNISGGRVALAARPSPTELTIDVTNTSPGVAAEEISRVFDQFYRAEKSRATQHGGFGLGLAIVKRIIELHGGEITFDSRQGSWTKVTVRLPLRQQISTS